MSDWTEGLVLIAAVTLLCPAVGQHRVIGSSQPVVAALGDDVILPCSVDPQVNVEQLVVYWWSPDIPPDLKDPLSQYRYVHFHQDNRSVEDTKMSSYAGRTALFKDELKRGNASLKIMNLRLADQGRYRCALPQLGSATVIQLIIEPKPDTSRTTQAPPLSRGFTTSKQPHTKGGLSTLGALVLAVAVWVAVVLCFGASGYLLKECQAYLPKYTIKGETQGVVFLPLKPV